MKPYLLILFLLLFSGCVPLPKDLFTSNEDLAIQHKQKVEVFQDLLNQGWEMQVYQGKLVLVKQTQSGLMINDVFGVLESD